MFEDSSFGGYARVLSVALVSFRVTFSRVYLIVKHEAVCELFLVARLRVSEHTPEVFLGLKAEL